MSTSTVPIFDPQGTLRDVPYDRMKDAVSAGGKPAVLFQAPDGKQKYVPADQTADAVKAGGKLLPIEQQEVQHPGFWHGLASDLLGMAKGAASIPQTIANPVSGLQFGAQAAIDDMARQQEGRSAAYRVAAPIAQAVTGVNTRGMEESANEGDIGGVLGHAAAPVVALGAGEALTRSAPIVQDAGAPVVRAAVRGVNKGLEKAPGTIGGTVGATVGGYLGGHVGAEVGGAAGAMAGREILPTLKIPGEGFGLPNRVEGGPAEAPAYEAPAQVQEAQPVPETPKPVPVSKQALESQLNDALGGRGLKPNVSLKNQRDVVTPIAQKDEQGFTPVKSSAISAYKYDPTAQEFTTITKSGSQYIHGDVNPDQVQAFEDADSKGTAWAKLKNNSTLVAKVVNGKRMPVRPPAELQSASPETTPVPAKSVSGTSSQGPKDSAQAQDDLVGILQQSLARAKAAKRAGNPQ